MKRLIVFVFVFLLPYLLAAQGIRFHGSLRNSVYALEEQESVARIYQYARFNAATADQHFTLNASLRALETSKGTLESQEQFKLYSCYVDGRDLIDGNFNFALGRMFLHPGLTLGGLDGVKLDYDFLKHFNVLLYTGTESHFKRSFEMYELGDSFVAGGALEVKKYWNSKLQLVYVRKANDEDVFWNLAGLNFDTAIIPKTIVRAQAHYDVENERMHRTMLSVRNSWTQKVLTTLEYKAQYPQIYANSYYAIFTPEAYQRYRFGASYEFLPNYRIEGMYQYVNFTDDAANQVYLTLGTNFGSLGFVWEDGYNGDQLGAMLDLYYELFTNFIASVYVDYSKYRVEQVYEYDNQLANAARVSYRLGKNWTFDLEYQWLTNRFKDSDHRLLNHISYVW